ncbi:YegP family protein [Thermoproteota archaeon]
MSGVFEVYKDSAGEYRFRLKASNGQTVLSSEGYSAKSGCMNGIESVKENCKVPERFETYEDKAGKHRFRLKAANGQVIGVGEAYETEASLEAGIESVKRWAMESETKET